ncbi:hypothetical protein SteCoe_27574 [Stentor coeruleus]|uniref:Uncharacterized protein n=1 Tax=Stentor coeruleus TaxID=5963 RepID=A0A1R2BA93_9CILI|nr:hypothetical protein SteCoe_27574 [Stentor coeruleus]
MERLALEKGLNVKFLKGQRRSIKLPDIEKEPICRLKTLSPPGITSERPSLLDPYSAKIFNSFKKRLSFPKTTVKSPPLQCCKSLSPKLQKKWLDNFIITVKNWETDSRELKSLEKEGFKIRSSLSKILKTVEDISKDSNNS